ncbi:MAG: urea carboxylase-associated family protein [Alphaproteobacteria bacterium]|nr:urea carboxylase-associated family protein [Alphaproteobacteria bacterium]
MDASPLIRVPARRGVATPLASGETIAIINTHGQQVVDTWAFRRDAPAEFMSMEHTRGVLSRTMPRVGDHLYTNHRRPILSLVDDSSPGIHDTLIAACDRYRYEMLGHQGHHDNCTENLRDALAALGITAPEIPCPLNLFMNIPVGPGGTLSFEPPVSKPGDRVRLRAMMDCIVVLSACPQDMVPINGVNCRPTDVHFEILAGPPRI